MGQSNRNFNYPAWAFELLLIGFGEVIQRIIGKCVMHVTKPDVIDASGSVQVCAGHQSGSEAAIHGMLFY